MGEIADMMISGLLCEQCGTYLDDDETPGYPRCCASCAEDQEIAEQYKDRIVGVKDAED